MSTQNLSPNFEERFAQIDINLRGYGPTNTEDTALKKSDRLKPSSITRSGKKKLYPSHLYPNGQPTNNHTTPSKQPVLSTAIRAKSRNLSSLLRTASNSLVPETPSRVSSHNISKQNNRSLSTIKQQPSRRILSCPMTDRPQRTNNDYQFSFMKETSSSMNKHVNLFNNTATSPTPANTADHTDIIQKRGGSFSSTTKKRHHRTRNVSNSNNHREKDRRIASSNVVASNYKPTDITNISYIVPSLKFQEIKSKDDHFKDIKYKNFDYENVLDSMNSPSKNKHVFQRVASESKQNICNKASGNNQKAKTEIPISDTPAFIENEKHPKQPSVCTTSNPTESSKVEDLYELYRVIYREDPTLFSVSDANKIDFCERKPLEVHQLVSQNNNASIAPLKIYERGEMLRKKDLYFLSNGDGSNLQVDERVIDIRNYRDNFGFDDKLGNYVIVPHDHIDYRYEVESILGNGSFGNVVKCKDHKHVNENKQNKVVAIKIIKNDINWSLQAVYETKMIKHLNDRTGMKNYTNSQDVLSDDSPVLSYFDHFNFRGHMCIVTEMLSLNLYSLLEITKFRGLSLSLIRHFAKRILKGLDFIHNQKIIHCDIKPENIMIRLPSWFNPSNQNSINENDLVVKIIDFGSSCFDSEISYSYIQSRFYRAPEVIIGANYTKMIDIWSFGCVISELFSGFPLLPGKSELEQVGLILELFGSPNSKLILEYRGKLVQSVKKQKAANNIKSIITETDTINPVINGGMADEKSIKKTLLYRLFDLEGKINLQFLNMRSQAVANSSLASSGTTAPKKKFKLNSKSLDILLRLHTFKEDKKDIHLFSKFLHLIFKWNASERSTAAELLKDQFLQGL